MTWFQFLKRESSSRINSKLIRTIARPMVNEFAEQEIIPKGNKIYRREIAQIVKRDFLPNLEIRKKIKADSRVKHLTSQQIGIIINNNAEQFTRMITYKLKNSGYDAKQNGTYYLKVE